MSGSADRCPGRDRRAPVAVHGQSDQWRLRHLDQHRPARPLRWSENWSTRSRAYRMAYEDHANAQRELTELRAHARERAQEAAALTVGLSASTPPTHSPARTMPSRSRPSDWVTWKTRAAASEATVLRSGADEASGSTTPECWVAWRAGPVRLAAGRTWTPHWPSLGRGQLSWGTSLTDLADVASYAAGLDVEDGRLDAVNERRALLERADPDLRRGHRRGDRLGPLRGAQAGWPARRRRSRGPTSMQPSAGPAAARDVAAQDLTRQRQRAAARWPGSPLNWPSFAMPHTVVAVEVRPAASRPGGCR